METCNVKMFILLPNYEFHEWIVHICYEILVEMAFELSCTRINLSLFVREKQG